MQIQETRQENDKGELRSIHSSDVRLETRVMTDLQIVFFPEKQNHSTNNLKYTKTPCFALPPPPPVIPLCHHIRDCIFIHVFFQQDTKSDDKTFGSSSTNEDCRDFGRGKWLISCRLLEAWH